MTAHKATPAAKDHSSRFDRTLRLVGAGGLDRLRRAHVMVIGCGGVGSWAAEAVARSAVGRITLIDFDTVCLRNFNRQLQAVEGTVGRQKVKVLAERLRLINPHARVDGVARPFSETTHAELMADRPDFVIDAIDHITAKCFLINYCRAGSLPFISSTGSGGRMDPTQVRVTDLGRTELDPLARAIRKILKSKYGFPRKGDFGVRAVCSLEPPMDPGPGAEQITCGSADCPNSSGAEFERCVKRSVVVGTAAFVTGAFGFACAAEAVRHIISGTKQA
jgi:tRNA A37 threonylcarbamoyladenosine dehydratase